MNLIELSYALRQLRLGGMAAVLEIRLQQAQAEAMAPIDLLSSLVSDELTRRADRLLERRRKQAGFRDQHTTLDNFDFSFNKKMNRSLVFDLATANFIARRKDCLFLGPPGSGKSHLAQAIGQAVIQQGYKVLYRETHTLLDELADATLDGTRKEFVEWLVSLPLLILDDLGMRKLPLTAAGAPKRSCLRLLRQAESKNRNELATERNGYHSQPAENSSKEKYGPSFLPHCCETPIF